jgi:primary-amine oxidase
MFKNLKRLTKLQFFFVISWANWVFHLGFDVQVGPIISLASIYDLEKQKYRQVLYRGFISEMFVPYMDPSEEWYYRSFFDCGEFGFGQSAVSLKPLADCPANTVFLDSYYAAKDGTPVKISNTFCIFENHAGHIMWRHTELGIPGEVVSDIIIVFFFFKVSDIIVVVIIVMVLYDNYMVL